MANYERNDFISYDNDDKENFTKNKLDEKMSKKSVKFKDIIKLNETKNKKRSFAETFGHINSRQKDQKENQKLKKEEMDEFVDKMKDLSKIRLSRDQMESWVRMPFFTDLVKGCFVKVIIGEGSDVIPDYRIAQIKDVSQIETRSNVRLILLIGKSTEFSRLSFVSNKKFLQAEFDSWRRQISTDKLKLPKLFIEEKVNNFRKYSKIIKKYNNDAPKENRQPLATVFDLSSDKEDKYVEKLEDFAKICLSKYKLEGWVHMQFFTDLVQGCFVKVRIGQDRAHIPIFVIAEIVGVFELEIRKNAGLILRMGKSFSTIRLPFVSNQGVSQAEFDSWRQQVIKDSFTLPKLCFLEEKAESLIKYYNYSYSIAEALNMRCLCCRGQFYSFYSIECMHALCKMCLERSGKEQNCVRCNNLWRLNNPH